MRMRKIYFVNIITGFFKCFDLAQRTTDTELCVLLSKRRMTCPEILAHSILDHGNIGGIEISQCFTW